MSYKYREQVVVESDPFLATTPELFVKLARANKLLLAQDWMLSGQFHNAAECLYEIIMEAPLSEEADEARLLLLEVAELCRINGRFRWARNIYDRLILLS